MNCRTAGSSSIRTLGRPRCRCRRSGGGERHHWEGSSRGRACDDRVTTSRYMGEAKPEPRPAGGQERAPKLESALEEWVAGVREAEDAEGIRVGPAER